ncbi:MAG: endonuclease/exonuclease/phosphatase family protein [Patescibacteria group bacterium]
MKIIFLNVWQGKVRDNLVRFLKYQSRDTDIFCLQEAYDETKPLLRDCLPGFKVVATTKPMAFGDNFFAQATYVKGILPILRSETLLEDENETGLGLTIHVRFKEQDFFICNFHGQTHPLEDNKMDSSTRLEQSEALIKSLQDKTGLKIIGGDFNILPEAESIRMFEERGYRDLIKEFGITTTRNRLSLDKYPNKEYFSDYCFVSPNIKVKNFSVPDIEVSDHLPLILEIEA